MPETPLVDVAMGTYNHAKYIAQALESVLSQKTDFFFRIIISDDFSTDDTRSIIMSYVEKYPERIVTLFPDRNYGLAHKDRPYPKVLQQCTAKYIAMLEGDDYWNSPDKLQKQVDFMESHPEYMMCFTNCSIVNEEGTIIRDDRLDEDRKKNLSQAEIFSGLVPPTNTVMYRNKLLEKIPDFLCTCANFDIIFFSLLTDHGDAGYLDENMACYRIHGEGVWSGGTKEYLHQNVLNSYCSLLKYYYPRHRDILLPKVQAFFLNLAEYYKSEGQFGKYIDTFFHYALSDLKHGNFSFARHFPGFIKSLLLRS